MAGAIFDESPAIKKYMEQKGGITTVLKTMDNCYDYLRYNAVMSVFNYMKARYITEGRFFCYRAVITKGPSPCMFLTPGACPHGYG